MYARVSTVMRYDNAAVRFCASVHVKYRGARARAGATRRYVPTDGEKKKVAGYRNIKPVPLTLCLVMSLTAGATLLRRGFCAERTVQFLQLR